MMKKKRAAAPPVSRRKASPAKKTLRATKTTSGSSDARQEERARRAAELESKASHSWEERKTLEGLSYYYNTKTEALTWDKPDALKSRASLKEKSADWCWVQDDREGWVPQRGKGKWMFAKSELKRLEQDIVMLDHINEAQIVRVDFNHNPSKMLRTKHSLSRIEKIYSRISTLFNTNTGT